MTVKSLGDLANITVQNVVGETLCWITIVNWQLPPRVEVGCLRHPGTSTNGSQLLDRDCSHGRLILATQSWAPMQKRKDRHLSRTWKRCFLVTWVKKIFLPSKKMFILTCLLGKGLGKSSAQYIIKRSKLRLALCKQNLRVTCPKGKLEFMFFSSPAISLMKLWKEREWNARKQPMRRAPT